MQKIRHFIYFIVLIAIDQISKYLIRLKIKGEDSITLIPKTLKIIFHKNTGAVWGIMQGKVILLSILTVIILTILIYFYTRIPMEKKFNLLKVIMVFIMAGAIGNLIDRIFIGYVTDFIYVELIDFPVFNIADSYITVAAVLLVILSLFYYKDEDFAFLEKLIPFKKNKDQDNSKQ